MSASVFVPLAADSRAAALELMRAYYAEDGHEFVPAVAEAALDAILADAAPAWFWLLQVNGAIVGYCCVTGGFSLEVAGGDFFLDELYVIPSARGRGLGQAAIRFAEDAARDRGAVRLCLEVQPDNHRAAALYERAGYGRHARPLLSKRL